MSRRKKQTHSAPSLTTAVPEKQTEPASELDPLSRHALDATRYAERIVSGEILAGKWARLACKRHLNDLQKSKSETYPYRFDLQLGGRVCAFIELLPNIDEPGEPNIILQPAQKFWLASVFGWVFKSTGKRRFNRVYLSMARKNGKTTLAAGIGLYMLGCDGEQSAQVYNGANNLRQAMLLFKPARRMVEVRPALMQRLGIEKRGEKRFYNRLTNGFWTPECKQPGDGGGASCFIQDEYHEAKTDDLSDAIVPGQIHRKQPLDWKITTAGVIIGGPCDRYEQQMKKVLEGTIQRERTFCIIYSIDQQPYIDPFGVKREPDDWTDLAAAPKANPLWGVSVDPEKFALAIEEALQDPHKVALVKTKHSNIWCNALEAFYDQQRWVSLAAADRPLDYFKGRDCVVGLDLASKYDLCAMVLFFRELRPTLHAQTGEETLEEHWYAFCRSYLPGSIGNLPESTDYRTWRDSGHLTITSGNITDYGYILRDLLATARQFNILEVDFDQRESGFLLQEFQKVEGTVPLWEVPQSRAVLSEPMRWLKSLVLDGKIHHADDPVFNWAMSNVAGDERSDNTIFPDHAGGNQALKIDPHSALLNAATRARTWLSQPAEPPEDEEVEVWS